MDDGIAFSNPDSPEYLQSANKMDPNLAGRLKDVYVTSVDPLPLDKVPSRYDPNRPLPINRYTELFDMGYKESRVVPKGRVSLLQAIKFITDHRDNPDEYTIQRIAEENEIKPEVAGEFVERSMFIVFVRLMNDCPLSADIIKHFRSFEVFIPGQTDKKALQEAVQKRLAATPNMKKLI